jgi:acetolactate synthase-1/2/3 large subunit
MKLTKQSKINKFTSKLKEGEKVQGADILCECLCREGISVIFGYPGGANIPIYDAIYKFPQLRHILVRHEQGAAHAAEGYAWITGRPGVCFATSGPGATNLVTGLADAMMDSIPMVCITGQVPSMYLGRDAFQEADVVGITAPITKRNYQVTCTQDIAYTIREAFHIASSGRPGPVLIDITKDAQTGSAIFKYPKKLGYRNSEEIKTKPSKDELKKVADLLNGAHKPLILAGHGVMLSGDGKNLLKVAEKMDAPIILTHLGLSAIPSNHRLFMGMPGMHGNVAANRATNEADVILVLGMRFSDRVTSAVNKYARQAKIIHIDIDPSEIGKNIKPYLGIVADAKEIMIQLLPLIYKKKHFQWLTEFKKWKLEEKEKVWLPELHSKKLKSAQVIRLISKETDGKATVVADVGQNQMYAARYYEYNKYNSHITSGGLGTMGFALPAGIGAKVADPKREVWIVIGDGGIQMTLQELATIVQENVDVKIALLNNNFLGMVRQWQELFYKGNYAETRLKNPNFQKLCQGFGIRSEKVINLLQAKKAIKTARATKGPYLIEFIVEAEENVFPMVPAGAGISEMLVSKDDKR